MEHGQKCYSAGRDVCPEILRRWNTRCLRKDHIFAARGHPKARPGWPTPTCTGKAIQVMHIPEAPLAPHRCIPLYTGRRRAHAPHLPSSRSATHSVLLPFEHLSLLGAITAVGSGLLPASARRSLPPSGGASESALRIPAHISPSQNVTPSNRKEDHLHAQCLPLVVHTGGHSGVHTADQVRGPPSAACRGAGHRRRRGIRWYPRLACPQGGRYIGAGRAVAASTAIP